METAHLPVWLLLLLPLAATRPPNIIFIVADDLGWNDVGFRNPDMITPNIDKMASDGIIFENAYVHRLCAPSRHAFMTGTYPFDIGVEDPNRKGCVNLDYTLLPQELKKLGYATHMIGKWHLGFCKWECTPTYRGFDTFFGFYNAKGTYYNHTDEGYLDFRDNMIPVNNYTGQYSTSVFAEKAVDIILKHDHSKPLFMYLPYQSVHAPMEVPEEYEELYPHVVNEGRRKFSGMVTALDDAIGSVTSALKERGLYDNTLILFTTDNGGSLKHYGNNWPLRSGKATIFEGGTRGSSFILGKGLKKTGINYDGLIHAVDWNPTLVAAAGGTPDPTLDGMNLWESIRRDLPSSRTEFFYDLKYRSPLHHIRSGIRVGDWKLLLGYPGQFAEWYLPQNHTEDDPLTELEIRHDYVYLFNIREDPTEHNNLADQMPEKVEELRTRMLEYRSRTMSKTSQNFDFSAMDPRNYGGIWSPGWC